jgi:hypothetical protein
LRVQFDVAEIGNVGYTAMLCLQVAVILVLVQTLLALRVQFNVGEIRTAGYTAMLCVQVTAISSLNPDIVSFENPALCSRDRDCRLHYTAMLCVQVEEISCLSPDIVSFKQC